MQMEENKVLARDNEMSAAPESGDMDMEDVEGNRSVSESLLDSNDEEETDRTPPLLPQPGPSGGTRPQSSSTTVTQERTVSPPSMSGSNGTRDRNPSLCSKMRIARLSTGNESVFETDAALHKQTGGALESSGHTVRSKVTDGGSFPPIYNIIKTNKSRNMAPCKLDSGEYFPRIQNSRKIQGGGGIKIDC